MLMYTFFFCEKKNHLFRKNVPSVATSIPNLYKLKLNCTFAKRHNLLMESLKASKLFRAYSVHRISKSHE